MPINLLPPIQKKEFQDEKTRQRIIVMITIVLANFLFFISIIFVLNFYSSGLVNGLTGKITEQSRLINSPIFQESKKAIDATNQDLFKISNVRAGQIYPVDVLETLDSLMSSEVYLKSFSFQNSKSKTKEIFGAIRISGVSKTRETLLAFKKILAQTVSFQEVYFDPASWVKAKNANFSASFSFTPVK